MKAFTASIDYTSKDKDARHAFQRVMSALFKNDTVELVTCSELLHQKATLCRMQTDVRSQKSFVEKVVASAQGPPNLDIINSILAVKQMQISDNYNINQMRDMAIAYITGSEADWPSNVPWPDSLYESEESRYILACAWLLTGLEAGDQVVKVPRKILDDVCDSLRRNGDGALANMLGGAS